VLRADLKVKAGITLAADFSVGATGGQRWYDCATGCFYGSVSADADLELALELKIDFCVEVLWWEKCANIQCTPAAVSVGITCEASYNSKEACDGPSGDCCLKDIIFTSDFKISEDIGLHFEKTVYETSAC
jgi:hypothetical protein